MNWLFFVFVLCAIAAIPIHYVSVEHARLEQKHGRITGIKVGELYGHVSAYMLFASLIGLWFSPQPRITIPILRRVSLVVPGIHHVIPVVHLMLFVPFVFLGLILLSRSVSDLTRKVSEAHRPERVVTTRNLRPGSTPTVSGVFAHARRVLSSHVGYILVDCHALHIHDVVCFRTQRGGRARARVRWRRVRWISEECPNADSETSRSDYG